jgi:uncharacterized membrane protein YsdA (DUF1294 family)/cold shock CspA family protein
MDASETREGTVFKWDDARGFGYIAPADGGHHVFAHIQAWPRGAGRPKLGDVVTFETELAPDGRVRASSVCSPFEVIRRESSGVATGTKATISLAGFIGLYLAIGLHWPVSPWIAVFYAVVSLITFLVYAHDKVAARAGRWRTKESTLHLLAFAGGWPGAILAQLLLHHKNRKASFQAVFWATVVANAGAFVLVSSPRFTAVLAKLVESLAASLA